MAKNYTSTVPVKCWKQHMCVGCDSVYSYLLERKAVGSGGSPETARKNMLQRIEKITQFETDMHACPNCGLYQPDMISQRRVRKLNLFFFFALLAMAAVLILRATDVLQTNILSDASIAIAVVFALLNLAVDFRNVNADVSSNRTTAQQAVSSGAMRFTAGKKAAMCMQNTAGQPTRSPLGLVGLVLLVGSIAAVSAPEALRASRNLPLNPDCYPPVVGPGDHTRFYMPKSISSLKGYWRGSSEAVIDNGASGMMLIDSHTNQNDWGNSISFKSDEKSSSSRPWIEFTVPEDLKTSARTVHCKLRLSIEYPELAGGETTFDTVHDEMNHDLALTLAPRLAGAQYDTAWWFGTAGGAGALLLATLLMIGQARGLRKLAKPTQVFTPEATGAAPPPVPTAKG